MRALGWTVMIGMIVAIGYGAANGDFGTEGSDLLSLAWGRVTVIDLYLMFAVFAAWVWWRERNPLRSLLWTVALAALGSVAAGAYLILAARAGSVRNALLGGRDE
ncbi:MAG: DUF1475 domain-containing protein [Acidimicrobiia bacterium]|nr:DUF1475 domain-containing protein [Acidimicrobiia bacterium]MDH4306167.1 DUF1475 domain-containing protein [Acidimicrobiia bacterium]MDH5292087.1 DUF1475 domain-containing protein [Acidimicrobiia bacterium]